MYTKQSVADSPARNNSEKTANTRLTENPQGATLENVPGSDTGHDVKQIEGGKVTAIQPPALSGFFMPATSPRDCNKLPGVARNKTPPSGNTCSALFEALNGSRQPYDCLNVKQIEEAYAMKRNNESVATPVATARGTRCLLPSSVLLDAIRNAKQQRQAHGKGNAYAELLERFHRAILPAFFIETEGNLSEVSRLLGIHRETVRTYATLAEVDMTGAAGKAGVA